MTYTTIKKLSISFLVLGNVGCGIIEEGGTFNSLRTVNNSLIEFEVEPKGENCVNGGTKVKTGLDDGRNGGISGNNVLENGETLSVKYSCNADVNGKDGKDGKDGVSVVNAITMSQISKTSSLEVMSSDGDLIGDFMSTSYNGFAMNIFAFNHEFDAIVQYIVGSSLLISMVFPDTLYSDSTCTTPVVPTSNEQIHSGIGSAHPFNSKYITAIFHEGVRKSYLVNVDRVEQHTTVYQLISSVCLISSYHSYSEYNSVTDVSDKLKPEYDDAFILVPKS